MSSESSSPMLIRPLVAGATAGLLDYYLVDNKDFKKAAYFGTAVAIGVGASGQVAKFVPDFSMGMLSNGKPVTSRITEIALGSVGAYSVNRFIFGQVPIQFNGFNNAPTFSQEFSYKIGIVAASDFIGELANDWYTGQNLNIFQ